MGPRNCLKPQCSCSLSSHEIFFITSIRQLGLRLGLGRQWLALPLFCPFLGTWLWLSKTLNESVGSVPNFTEQGMPTFFGLNGLSDCPTHGRGAGPWLDMAFAAASYSPLCPSIEANSSEAPGDIEGKKKNPCSSIFPLVSCCFSRDWPEPSC